MDIALGDGIKEDNVGFKCHSSLMMREQQTKRQKRNKQYQSDIVYFLETLMCDRTGARIIKLKRPINNISLLDDRHIEQSLQYVG